MCIGVPMRVVETGPGWAMCEDGDALRHIDTMLVGEVRPGDWVLVFIDAAREVLAEEEALKIRDALAALSAVLRGETEVDDRFPDLVRREEGR